MDVLTRSSSTRGRNTPARLALVFGLAAVVTLPVAIALTRLSARYELLHAAAAIPLAALLGLLAVVFGRRGRGTLLALRVGGETTAAIGRALGVLGLCLAAAAAISVGFYWLLVALQ